MDYRNGVQKLHASLIIIIDNLVSVSWETNKKAPDVIQMNKFRLRKSKPNLCSIIKSKPKLVGTFGKIENLFEITKSLYQISQSYSTFELIWK